MLGNSPALTVLIFVVAIVYSTVGQAGASGYLAAMGAFGFEPAVMKPTALALNLTVAGIGAVRFAQAGHFDWRAYWPFALLGLPAAYLGGAIRLPSAVYYPLVGTVLLVAAVQLARSAFPRAGEPHAAIPERPPVGWSIATGAAVGLLSGITGTGGGVFLAPVLLLAGWADARRAAGLSTAYNLLGSAAALAGAWTAAPALPPALPGWILAAAAGALIGSQLGRRGLPTRALRLILGGILAAAGLRMLVA